MKRILLALAILLSASTVAEAQISKPLRILNAGTQLPLEYKLNFVNGGCVDNPGLARIDCTFTGGQGGTTTAFHVPYASAGNTLSDSEMSFTSGTHTFSLAATTVIDWSGSSGAEKTTTGAFSFSGATVNFIANTTFTGASSATNTTALTITTNVADGATSIANQYTNTAAITSGGFLAQWTNGIAPMFAIQPLATSTWLWGSAAGNVIGTLSGLRLSDQLGTILKYNGQSVEVNTDVVGPSFHVGSADVINIQASSIAPVTNLTGYSVGDSTHYWNGAFSVRFTSSAAAAPSTSALGTNVTSVTAGATSTDAWGTLTIVTGGNTIADQSLATVSFNVATGYPAAPKAVLIVPANNQAATSADAQWYADTLAQGSFSLKNHGTLAAQTYIVYYMVGG